MSKPDKPTRGVSKKPAFLAAFRITASITKAAAAVGIERQMHYTWLREDPEYLPKFRDAQREAAQVLEDEAVRRAHEGIEEPVVYQGEIAKQEHVDADGVVTMRPVVIRKYSDRLLIELLRATNPEKFRTNVSAEISGPQGGPIAVTDSRLAALDDGELQHLIEIAKKMEGAE